MPPAVGRRRLVWGLVMAALAAVSAIGSGFVSEAESTTYRWRVGAPSVNAPSNVKVLDSASSFVPLLLADHTPQRIRVRWTCGRDALVDSAKPFDVVATSRDALAADGLIVRSAGSRSYRIQTGATTLTRVTTGVPSSPPCDYTARINQSGQWTVSHEDESLASGENASFVVTGVRTDLLTPERPSTQTSDVFVSLDIETTEHGPSRSRARTALRLAAAALTLGATTLVALAVSPTRYSQAKRRTSNGDHFVWRAWIDTALVIALLSLWWVLGPALFDDGWVMATIENYPGDGVFTSYYDSGNAPLPLGYLHDLVLRVFASVSNRLIWLRGPALIAGVTTWLLVKNCVDMAGQRLGTRPSLRLHLVAGAAFVLGWISFNNTLRPEPFIALLVATAMWACLRFTQSRNPIILMVIMSTIGVGISLGVSAVTVLAPPIALIPTVLSRSESLRGRDPFILAASLMIGVAVMFLAIWSMGDAGFWAEAVNSFRAESAHGGGITDEPRRYLGLFVGYYSSSTRRLAVLLPGVAILMFLLRQRSQHDPLVDLPSLGLLFSLILLALTPSKWIWHFGALVPLATASIGIEWQRWKTRRSRGIWPHLLVIGCAIALSVASWSGSDGSWNDFALLELSAVDGVGRIVGSVLTNPTLWIVGVLVAVSLVSLKQGASLDLVARVRKSVVIISPWVVPVSAFIGVALTVALFAADGLVVSEGWSVPRQNLDGSSCGLADEIEVSSGQMDRSLQDVIEERGGLVLVAPQVRTYFPCLVQPLIKDGKAEIPTLVVSVGGWPIGLPESPHHYLNDVAVLRRLSVDWTYQRQPNPIVVHVIEEVGTK